MPENEHSSPCIFKVTGRVTTGEPGNTPAPKEPEAASRVRIPERSKLPANTKVALVASEASGVKVTFFPNIDPPL